MLPEEFIHSTLLSHDILSLSQLDKTTRAKYVLMVRTSASRELFDVNKHFVGKTYNFLLHCFINGSDQQASEFSETVADIIEESGFSDNVESTTVSGGVKFQGLKNPGLSAYTISVSITI